MILAMRGRALSVAVIACLAACAGQAAAPAPRRAPAVAPTSRPRLEARVETQHVVGLDEEVEAKLIPYPTWIRRMPIDDVILVETSPPGPPAIPEPMRPAVGSDTLEIADRARVRGDALDAIAQYRALLPRAPASALPYIELQLARSHAALHQFDEAVRRLNTIIAGQRGDSRVHWPAVAEMASIRIRGRGDSSVETLHALAPYVTAYGPDLGLHVLYLAEPQEQDDVLAWLSAHELDASSLCAYQLAALALGPSALPTWGWCPERASSDQATRRELRTLVVLAVVEMSWERHPTNAAHWIATAFDASQMVEHSTGPTRHVASWVALAACYNAAAVGAAAGTRLEHRVDRREEIVSNLVLAHKAEARRLLSVVMVGDPP